MSAYDMATSIRRRWPHSIKEAMRRNYLATRTEREEALGAQWRASQAFHTKAPGTVTREALRQVLAEKLSELRDLVNLYVELGATPTEEERAAMFDSLHDTFERIDQADAEEERVTPIIPPPMVEPSPSEEKPGAFRRFLGWFGL